MNRAAREKNSVRALKSMYMNVIDTRKKRRVGVASGADVIEMDEAQ